MSEQALLEMNKLEKKSKDKVWNYEDIEKYGKNLYELRKNEIMRISHIKDKNLRIRALDKELNDWSSRMRRTNMILGFEGVLEVVFSNMDSDFRKQKRKTPWELKTISHRKKKNMDSLGKKVRSFDVFSVEADVFETKRKKGIKHLIFRRKALSKNFEATIGSSELGKDVMEDYVFANFKEEDGQIHNNDFWELNYWSEMNDINILEYKGKYYLKNYKDPVKVITFNEPHNDFEILEKMDFVTTDGAMRGMVRWKDRKKSWKKGEIKTEKDFNDCVKDLNYVQCVFVADAKMCKKKGGIWNKDKKFCEWESKYLD